MNNRVRLWHIEFDAAHPDEPDCYTVVQSEKEPTKEWCEKVLPMCGAIYVQSITEVTEKDIRGIALKRIIYRREQNDIELPDPFNMMQKSRI
ncbi:hypothetical protein [Sulfurimonas sp. HSL-1716]|uniref:hypothetical protein n=1 Tax=Hydrocurvibacter sulfurireducens TaxID=3131937 RepID=UPI0031F7A0B9